MSSLDPMTNASITDPLISLLQEALRIGTLPPELRERIADQITATTQASLRQSQGHPAIIRDPEKGTYNDLILMASSAWIRLPGAHPERCLYLVNKTGKHWSEEGLLLEYWPQGVGETEDPLWADFIPLEDVSAWKYELVPGDKVAYQSHVGVLDRATETKEILSIQHFPDQSYCSITFTDGRLLAIKYEDLQRPAQPEE